MVGRSAAVAELGIFYSRIESVGTSYWEQCRRDQTVFAEVEVRFIDAAGADRHIPCVIVARWGMGQLVDLRFDLDPSPPYRWSGRTWQQDATVNSHLRRT